MESIFDELAVTVLKSLWCGVVWLLTAQCSKDSPLYSNSSVVTRSVFWLESPRLALYFRTCRASYMIEQGICYLTLADKGYPKRLAFLYLEEIHQEFVSELRNDHGEEWRTKASSLYCIRREDLSRLCRRVWTPSMCRLA